MNKQIWVGLVEVQPLLGSKLLEEAKGAYVHAMAWAENPEEFRQRVALRAADLLLEIIDIREIEPWSIRASSDNPIRPDFLEMESRISSDVRGVAFGRFHAWFQDPQVASHTRPR